MFASFCRLDGRYTLVNNVFSNAVFPISVRPSCNVTLVILGARPSPVTFCENALCPMVVTDAGMSTDSNWFPLNASLSINFTVEGRLKEVSGAFLNAILPIVSTPSGIVSSLIFVALNAEVGISFKDLESVTFSKEALAVNAPFPSVVTLSGMVTSVSAVVWNAVAPIDVTVSGIVTFVIPIVANALAPIAVIASPFSFVSGSVISVSPFAIFAFPASFNPVMVVPSNVNWEVFHGCSSAGISP